jgi:SPP1 family phage portal protein
MNGENRTILERVAHEEPDNRICIPIVRKAVTITSGYMAKVGDIVYSTAKQAKRKGIGGVIDAVKKAVAGDYFDAKLKPIFDSNDEQLTTHEEFETACAHGMAWEYHYTADGEPRFVEIPVEQCIPIWTDDLPPKLGGFIRYYTTASGTDQEMKEALVFDDAKCDHYIGKTFNDLGYVAVGSFLHGYGEVPFAQAKINRYAQNLFDHVRTIIDFRDRIVSEDYANEAQRFSSSYLLLRNRLSDELDASGLSDLDKIKITRTFEDLGDNVNNAVAFLVKNIPIDFIKNADELFERLSYDMMMLFDNNDMATTGQISGISLAYKLLPFEYACATYEAYFSRFLQWRIRLIQNVTGNMSVRKLDRPQVSIQFRRNLPFDMQSAVDMFTKLSPAALPIKTALKLFPASFIDDPDQVAKEMEAAAAMPNMDTEDEGETNNDNQDRRE